MIRRDIPRYLCSLIAGRPSLCAPELADDRTRDRRSTRPQATQVGPIRSKSCVAVPFSGVGCATNLYHAARFRKHGVLSYLVALLLGIAATSYFLPSVTVLGSGGLWVNPGGDLAENLTGHLAFQATGWHWPLLLAPNLAWPHGTSIAMTDSNPLVSLVAKALAGLRGAPVNLFGVWLAACWLLQPVAAVYALHGFGYRVWEADLAAAVLAVLFPALLARFSHINLLGHFLLLYALGMALRMLLAGSFPSRRWIGAAVLLSAAALCHPYLYVFAAAVLAAPVLRAVIDRQANAGRTFCYYLATTATPVVIYAGLSGTLGGGDRGFGFYSMNLLSPFWPQQSGLFGSTRPIIDATGGQYEGFNYLGAGGLLLLAAAIAMLLWRRDLNWTRYRALVFILAALTLLALSPRVYLGHTLILSLGVKPWDQMFGPIQSSGRAFWLVGYTLVLASIARLTRDLPPPILRIVLSAAIVLQLSDTAPLRASAREYFSGREEHPIAITPLLGAHLLTLVPVCTHAGQPAEVAGKLRLSGVRAGMWLHDMRVSRLPGWFNCEQALTDGVETPLVPQEMRVFLEPPATTLFRQAALGPDATCRGVEQMIVCARGLPVDLGSSVLPGAAIPALDVPAIDLAGVVLKPLLSYGWQDNMDGLPWSEGPRATLVFRLTSLPQIGSLLLDMQLEGVARLAGGSRPISVQVGAGSPIDFTLPDMRPATLHLRISASSIVDGVVRIAIDIDHPVDPRTRGLVAPVGRAGVRLKTLSANWID